jgi:MFS family permease
VKDPKIFYGWFVVAACFAVTFTMGETFWSLGIFFKPIENEFGWTRSLISSAYTAFLIGCAISVITAGKLADKHSPRPILLGSALSAGLGISLCSQSHNIDQLRLFLFIAGLGAGATWSVPTSTVQRWFYRRHGAGMALAIVVSGVGMGAIVFAPLVNYFVLTYGWRYAFLLVGIIFFLLIALSSLVIKRSPTDISSVFGKQESMPNAVAPPRPATGKAVTSRSFVCISFIVCVLVVTFQVISVHLVPHATDVGISPTAAAAALGLMGGISIPGRILSGVVSQRIGWQKTLAISLFGMALSLIWLLFLETTWMLYCFVAIYGIFHGIRVTAQVGILGQFFGMRSLGELIGVSTAIAQFVSAFAPYMAGFIFDVTGSYSIAFIIVMALLFSGGSVAIVMKRPSIAPE